MPTKFRMRDSVKTKKELEAEMSTKPCTYLSTWSSFRGQAEEYLMSACKIFWFPSFLPCCRLALTSRHTLGEAYSAETPSNNDIGSLSYDK